MRQILNIGHVVFENSSIGYVKRRHHDYAGRKTLEMVPPERKKKKKKKSERRKTRSMTELAGGELCLPQRSHNQVGAARRRRRSIRKHIIKHLLDPIHSQPSRHRLAAGLLRVADIASSC